MDIFQVQFLGAETKSRYKMKAVCADRGRKFISIKFKTFYQKKEISIKYAKPYIYKKNGLVKKNSVKLQ